MRRARSGTGWSVWRAGVAGLVAAVTAATVAVVAPAVVGLGTPAGAATCLGSRFYGGPTTQISVNQELCEGSYTLIMQPDGNLVEYEGTVPVWATGTSAGVEADIVGGDFRVLAATGGVLWQTNPAGPTTTLVSSKAGDKNTGTLTLNRNGNLVLFSDAKNPNWQNGARTANYTVGLEPGQTITSPGDVYQLAMQTDGNLVLYFDATGEHVPVWSTGTAGNPTADAVLQTDGNFVVYAAAGVALWSAGSSGSNPTLAVQEDGNIAVYATNANGQYAAWASNTVGDRGPRLPAGQTLQPNQFLLSPTGEYKLQMSAEGVLALYSTQPYACPLWTAPTIAGTSGYATTPQAGSYAAVSPTGDLDLDAPGTTSPWWSASQTAAAWTGAGSGTGDYLTLQSDGNLVLYAPGGVARWDSGTNSLRGFIFCAGTTLTAGEYLRPWTVSTSGTATPLAASPVPGQLDNEFVMQGTCNLVFYYDYGAVWASTTDATQAGQKHASLGGTPSDYKNCYAKMQTTGNLVIYAPTYPGGQKAIWSSGTDKGSTAFNVGAIGPYMTVPAYVQKTGTAVPFVLSAHGETLGNPSPPSKGKVLTILSYIFDALGFVFTFVAGPLGDVFEIGDALGNALGVASIAGDAGATANAGVTAHRGNAVVAQTTTTGGSALCGTGQLSSGSHLATGLLTSGQCLISPNRQFELVMQADGNLVLYNHYGGALWATGTVGNPGAFLQVQANGSMGVVAADNRTQLFYATGSVGTPDPNLVLENTGNLVLYAHGTGGGVPTAVWAAGSEQVTVSTCTATSGPNQLTPGVVQPGACLFSPNKKYRLQMQTDGNLVLTYVPLDQPLWSSNTADHPGSWLQLWPDGSLTVEAPTAGQVWWPNGTTPNAVLVLENNGNLELYGDNSTPDQPVVPYSAWQTGTNNLQGDELPSGSVLSPGQYLQSPTGTYKLSMGTNGLLELSYLTRPAGQAGSYFCPIWSKPGSRADLIEDETGATTYQWNLNPGSYLEMQKTGNLVLYPGTTTAAKTATTPETAQETRSPHAVSVATGTTTTGDAGAYLKVQSDGNLVVYTPTGKAVWSSGTNDDRGTALCTNARLSVGQYLTEVGKPTDTKTYVLTMASNCELEYLTRLGGTASNNIYWHTTKSLTTSTQAAGCYATMQKTGNLVIYAPNKSTTDKVVWASNTVVTTPLPNLVQTLGPYTLVNAGADLGQDTDTGAVMTDAGKVLWRQPTVKGTNAAADANSAVSGLQTLVGILVFLLPLLL
jgi:hypothetical protein